MRLKKSLKKLLSSTVVILLAGLSVLILSSCASPLEYAYREVSQDSVDTAPGMPMEEYLLEEEYVQEELEMARSKPDSPDYDPSAPGVGEPSLRHVIRRGSIDLSVSDTREKLQEVQKIVQDAEGLVSNLYVYEIREGQYGARATLRVPEASFEPVLEQLETLGKATNIQTELEDITMHYIDLESRLNNQKAQEERLTEILEMADTVEDVLEVEKELNRVRGEIESMSARLTSLKDQVTYATIDISLREEAIPTGTVSPHAFHNLGTRISEAFVGSINFILNAVSGLIILFTALIPALVVILAIGFIIWAIVRGRLKKRALKKEDDQEQPIVTDDNV